MLGYNLSSKYIGREGCKLKISTRKLVISAMLITADVLLTRVLAINTPLMKIGLGFTACALSGILYGPWWAALTAALGDFIGSVIFPVGPFFPGFTLTAALTGFIFGALLYKRGGGLSRPVLAAFLNCLLIILIANTAMISFISGSPFKLLLAARAVQFLVMFPIQSLLLSWLYRSRLVTLQLERIKE